MTTILLVALGVALIDWFAVARDVPALEMVAKPAVMVALIVAALTADTGTTSVQVLVVVGLAFGLAGDVALLPAFDKFIVGLASFLVGHLAYALGFLVAGQEVAPLALGAVVAATLIFGVGRSVLSAVAATAMAWPVRAYFVVISAMVVTAIGTGSAWFGVGAVVFALSDALLGHDRFVTPRLDRRVIVHMLYHLGQMAIVGGLL